MQNFCQPGIKPKPPQVKAQSLNHWTTKEVFSEYIYNKYAEVCLLNLPSGCSHRQFPLPAFPPVYRSFFPVSSHSFVFFFFLKPDILDNTSTLGIAYAIQDLLLLFFLFAQWLDELFSLSIADVAPHGSHPLVCYSHPGMTVALAGLSLTFSSLTTPSC